MSPPVLGSLLCLCIAYILPAGNGETPYSADEVFSDSETVHLPLASDEETLEIADMNEGESGAVQLLEVKTGLAGLFCSMPGESYLGYEILEKLGLDLAAFDAFDGKKDLPTCSQCSLHFLHGECVYLWKGMKDHHRKPTAWLYHESCVIQFVKSAPVRLTSPLPRVRELLLKTDDAKLLSSLFAVEDDLVCFMNPEASIEVEPDSRARKFRRLMEVLDMRTDESLMD